MNILFLTALLTIPVAAISPSNPDGPRMTMDGKVIGVNTHTISNDDGSDRIDLSIRIDAVKKILAEYKATTDSSCPSLASLSRPWIEHRGSIPAAIHVAHLSSALNGATVSLVPMHGQSRWIGTSRRGRGEEPAEPGCFVLGSAALYANGPEEAPTVDFVATVNSGSEASLGKILVELRWYDPKDGRKHRWINPAWPIPLPQTINELLNQGPL